MTLIKCPECGHEVSNQAKQCMNCGVPIQLNKNIDLINLPINNKKPYFAWIILGLALLTFMLPPSFSIYILPVVLLLSILIFVRKNKNIGAISIVLCLLALTISITSLVKKQQQEQNKQAIQEVLQSNSTNLEDSARISQQ